MGISKMVGLRVLTLSLVLVLIPDTVISDHIVEEVVEFLNTDIDFVGHDEGFRKHITALQKDLDKLEDSKLQNSNLATSLNMVHTIMKEVEDTVVNLARRSKTDVSGLETSLVQFKRQVDRGLSTDNSYRSIMEHTGMLIKHAKEIKVQQDTEIKRAVFKMNDVLSTLTSLRSKDLEKQQQKQQKERTTHESGFWGSVLKFVGGFIIAEVADYNDNEKLFLLGLNKTLEGVDGTIEHGLDWIFGLLQTTEDNLKKSLDYFKREAVLIGQESATIIQLANKHTDYDYQSIEEGASELKMIIKDGDWDTELMQDVRSLKRSVGSFVSMAGNW